MPACGRSTSGAACLYQGKLAHLYRAEPPLSINVKRFVPVGATAGTNVPSQGRVIPQPQKKPGTNNGYK
jgi:hypothetical protein